VPRITGARGSLWAAAYRPSRRLLKVLRFGAEHASFMWRAFAPFCRLESIVLDTIAVVLLVLWLLGWVASFAAGGFLHALLFIAVIMVIFQLFSGSRVD